MSTGYADSDSDESQQALSRNDTHRSESSVNSLALAQEQDFFEQQEFFEELGAFVEHTHVVDYPFIDVHISDGFLYVIVTNNNETAEITVNIDDVQHNVLVSHNGIPVQHLLNRHDDPNFDVFIDCHAEYHNTEIHFIIIRVVFILPVPRQPGGRRNISNLNRFNPVVTIRSRGHTHRTDFTERIIVNVTQRSQTTREIGNGNTGIGNGNRETGNGNRETGNGNTGIGNGNRETGNGNRETGNGNRETGNENTEIGTSNNVVNENGVVYSEAENNMETRLEENIPVSDSIPLLPINPHNEPAEAQEHSRNDNPESLTIREERVVAPVDNLPNGLATLANARADQTTINSGEEDGRNISTAAERINLNTDNLMRGDGMEAAAAPAYGPTLDGDTVQNIITQHEEQSRGVADAMFDASRTRSAREESEISSESEIEEEIDTDALRRMNVEFGRHIMSVRREHTLGANVADMHRYGIINSERERLTLVDYASEISRMFTDSNEQTEDALNDSVMDS